MFVADRETLRFSDIINVNGGNNRSSLLCAQKRVLGRPTRWLTRTTSSLTKERGNVSKRLEMHFSCMCVYIPDAWWNGTPDFNHLIIYLVKYSRLSATPFQIVPTCSGIAASLSLVSSSFVISFQSFPPNVCFSCAPDSRVHTGSMVGPRCHQQIL